MREPGCIASSAALRFKAFSDVFGDEDDVSDEETEEDDNAAVDNSAVDLLQYGAEKINSAEDDYDDDYIDTETESMVIDDTAAVLIER